MKKEQSEMSKFEYPWLKRREIVDVLAKSLIVNISDADLLQPNPDLVSNLYNAILTRIDSFLEDHGHLDFEVLQRLENPEHHVDSIRMIKLCNTIREILDALQCPEKFTLCDLLRPNPDRTEFFLGVILNFYLHREEKMDLLTPTMEELTRLDVQRQQLEAREAQLNAELADYNESLEREMPLVQEVDAKVNELKQMIPALNNHQMSLKASIKKLKEKVKEIDEKISNAEFVLVQSVQENATLRSKIVQSPDKLQKALEDKKLVQAEAKNAERAAMQSFQDKSTVLEIYTKACKKMSKYLTQMQALQEQVNSAKSVENEVKVLKIKLSDEEMFDKSLEAKLVERQGKSDQLDELKKQLEKDRDINWAEASKELNNVKLELESKRHELESRKKEVEAMVAEGESIMSKIKSVKEAGAAKQQELGSKCEEVMQSFRRYSSSIRDLLPMIEEPSSLRQTTDCSLVK